MSTCPKPEPFVLDPKMVFVPMIGCGGVVSYQSFRYDNQETRNAYEHAHVWYVFTMIEEAAGMYVHRCNIAEIRLQAVDAGRNVTFTDCPPAIDPAGAWAMMSVTARET